jgi:hypothetical protein
MKLELGPVDAWVCSAPLPRAVLFHAPGLRARRPDRLLLREPARPAVRKRDTGRLLQGFLHSHDGSRTVREKAKGPG